MASALVQGVVQSGALAAGDIIVSDVIAAAAQRLATVAGVAFAETNADLVAMAEALVLCVKPNDALDALRSLRAGAAEKLVISIVAGLPIAALQEAAGPGVRIVRVMPNTPALVHKGAAAYSLGATATGADAALTEKVFGAVGEVVCVKENLLDVVTGLSGSGPAYIYVVIDNGQPLLRRTPLVSPTTRRSTNCRYSSTAGKLEGSGRSSQSPPLPERYTAMSRVISTSGTFVRHHGGVLRRFEMTDALVRNASETLPGLVVVRVDLLKRYENEEYRVDLVIFDLPGHRWWVGRMVPQVEDFELDLLLPTHGLRRTKYLTDDVEEILSKTAAESGEAIQHMVSSVVPGVLSFVSHPNPEWFKAVREHEGSLAIFETYSNSTAETLIRVNGDIPVAVGTKLCECREVVGMASVLKLIDQGGSWPLDSSSITYQGETIMATTIKVGDDIMIHLESGLPGTDNMSDLSVWKLAPGQYAIRKEGLTQ